jgi:hypothetical protein
MLRKAECPHCGLVSVKIVLQRWHMDQCEYRGARIPDPDPLLSRLKMYHGEAYGRWRYDVDEEQSEKIFARGVSIAAR